MISIKSMAGKLSYFVLPCVLIALWILPTGAEVLCSGTDCYSSAPFSGSALKSNLVQTFDVEIQVSPNSGKNYISDFRDKKKGVGLSWNLDQQLLITVPMRYGAADFFGYTTPKNLEFKSIRIRIVKSESVYIFLDDKIAYSHRYENSPFFINSLSPVDTPKGAGRVGFTATVTEEFIENRNNPFSRVGHVMLIFGIVAFATVALLRRFFQDRPKKIEIQQTLSKSTYGLVGISWGLSILVWIRNPIDSTGAINPGPFGPIGAAFSDFYQLSQLSQFDRPYDLGGTNYPPGGIFFLRLMSFYDPNNLSFFPIAGVMLGTLYFLFIESSSKKSAGLIFLGSFPFVFGVVRGNLDLLAIFFVWISILAWRKGRNYSAATILAFAISLKIWPVIFLLIFIKKRNRSLFFVTALLALGLTILASFALGYTNPNEIVNIASSAIFDQTKLGTYAFQNTFSFSSLLFISHIALIARNPFDISQFDVDNSLTFVNSVYSLLIIALLLSALIYIYFKSKHEANEFLILSGVVLLIPTQSFTYRALIVLLYFYLRQDTELATGKMRSGNPAKIRIGKNVQSVFLKRVTIWSTIPLFAPTAFYFIPGTQFSTASLFQPLGLLIFMGLVIYEEHKSNTKVD